jgi:S-adenosylmethionine decarboxylase
MTMLRSLMTETTLEDSADVSDQEDSLFSQLKREHSLALKAIKAHHVDKIHRVTDIPSERADFLGRHLLAEFKIIPEKISSSEFQTNPVEFFKNMLLEAAKAAEATILGSHASQTQAGDVWGIVVIEESHFSLHYRKAQNFLAIDVFTCGLIKLKSAITYIESALGISPYDQVEFKRGIYQADDKRFLEGIALPHPENESSYHFFKHKNQRLSLGQHVISEFYGCHVDRINNADFVLKAFNEGLTAGGARKDGRFTFVHQFSPQGISAVVCGEDFHLTIHDWPEHGYGAIDVCAFGEKIHLLQVMKEIAEFFQAERTSQYAIPRGSYRFDKKLLQPVFKEYLFDMADSPKSQPTPRLLT